LCPAWWRGNRFGPEARCEKHEAQHRTRHDLIKSLKQASHEKRFFKLHSALQSGDKNYLRIFDAIDKQKVYDEEGMKKLFAKETFIKHLPSEKNHLYKLILKALRAYHCRELVVSGMLKQEIKNIEILYQKALYVECNKLLHRAKRIAGRTSASTIGSSC
jgi:hypothetical protein